MTATQNAALNDQVQAAAQLAGLQVLSAEQGQGESGHATVRYTLAPTQAPEAHPFSLELSASFDAPAHKAEFAAYLRETARRLQNPRPDLYLTLSGLPLRFSTFAWPFHESSAGADTSIVHGQVNLEDGHGSPLFAKLAATMTVTFREVLAAPEQPFAEAAIYNAVRKTFDQGQLELVKSGNRQPVVVTTRYYSTRQQKFTFTDTTEAQRTAFLAAKAFWLSGVLGDGRPVWLLDPRDAQYLNVTPAELKPSLDSLIKQGLIAAAADPEFATPTESLMAKRSAYEAGLAEALAFIKPTFNEDMRGGLTNM